MDSGVFGTGLSFGEFITTTLVLIGGIVAVRLSFSFDINKYMDSKQEKLKAKAQNACTHFEFVRNNNGDVEARSFFVSPPGTLNYICQTCTVIRLHLDTEVQQREIEYYAKNINEYNKMKKKFQKLLKKAGQA